MVFIAVAGRSNGLGPVLSGNTTSPVINCPPLSSDSIARDAWSSLDLPSGFSDAYTYLPCRDGFEFVLCILKLKIMLTGLGCTTALQPEGAALAAAQIYALNNHIIWARLRAKQLSNYVTLKETDMKFRKLQVRSG